MGKDKKKKFLSGSEKEEKVVKKEPGKGKLFDIFKKKKINSSDEFQVNLSSENGNNEEATDFGYNEFDESQTSVNNPTADGSPSPAESSGYIPNEQTNETPEYNNYSANNLANNNAGNSNYEEDYSNLYDESSDDGSDIYLPNEEDEPLDNGDERIKKLSEAYKKARKPQNCLVVLIMVIIAIIGLFFNGIALIIGGIISFISVFGAIFKYQDRVKYSKPVLYLAVIVLAGYAFAFVYVKDVFNSVDEVKAIAFKDKAVKFIEQVRDNDINKERKLKCIAKGVKKGNFTLPKYDSDAYSSPFGNSFNTDDSYVLVEAEMIEGKCTYKYSIYLTDNSYQLGTLYAPVEEKSIENSKVTRR